MKEGNIRSQELTHRYIKLSEKYSKHCVIGDKNRDLGCIAFGSKNTTTSEKIVGDILINFLKDNAKAANSSIFYTGTNRWQI